MKYDTKTIYLKDYEINKNGKTSKKVTAKFLNIVLKHILKLPNDNIYVVDIGGTDISDKYSVVRGCNEIFALKQYINNEFVISIDENAAKKLKIESREYAFKDLPAKIQRSLVATEFRTIIIESIDFTESDVLFNKKENERVMFNAAGDNSLILDRITVKEA